MEKQHPSSASMVVVQEMRDQFSNTALPGLRIVFVAPVTPAFTGNGLAMRAASLVEALVAQGCRVDLIVMPILEGAGVIMDMEIKALCSTYEVVARPRREPSFWSRVSAAWTHFFSRDSGGWKIVRTGWQRKMDVALSSLEPDLFFVFRLSTFAEIAPSRWRRAAVWLDLDEVDSAALLREAELAKKDGDGARCNVLQGQAAVTKKREESLFPLARWLSVSSAVEQQRLPEDLRHRAIVLPNVVRPRLRLRARGEGSGPFALLFVGNFRHGANVDAVAHFCREVLPRIQQRSARAAEFIVVGSDPRKQLARFKEFEGVRLMGWVEDLASIYQEADLVVVPLRTGAGTRIKILEAFSYGRGVVSTACGAEGLDVSSGAELIVAESDEAFAEACVDLLYDPDRSMALVRRAAEWVAQRHFPTALKEAFAASWNTQRTANR